MYWSLKKDHDSMEVCTEKQHDWPSNLYIWFYKIACTIFYFPILQLYFSFPTAMQMGATAGSEDFEEDYGAVDIMSSLERDIGM